MNRRKLMIIILTVIVCTFLIYFFLFEDVLDEEDVKYKTNKYYIKDNNNDNNKIKEYRDVVITVIDNVDKDERKLEKDESNEEYKENNKNDIIIYENNESNELIDDMNIDIIGEESISCENDVKKELKKTHFELYNELLILEQDILKYNIREDSCFIWDMLDQRIYNASDLKIATLFVHIRKTGGTSFSDFLTDLFDCECPDTFNGGWYFHDKCRCQKNLHNMHNFLVHSKPNYHQTYPKLSTDFRLQKPHLTPNYITIFREPIHHFHSVFKHCRYGYCFNYIKDKISRNISDFMDFTGEIFYNQQVKTLLLQNIRMNLTLEPDHTLALAKLVVLENITFFGLNEYFHESTRLFAKASSLNFHSILEEHLNSKPYSHSMTPEVVSFLESKLSLDIRLYHFLNLLFLFRLEQSPID
eukprot:TRINITY_DN14978_c0_g1_i1.p1 TRINITY_DN14978_c0_g1~~TRINITY_DN14978_c0_g1_i1.p1  ORF type:complete len:415 (+),score=61.11 TRINITY_DN14978_c0_g1_i1:64-1308(+)